MAIQGLDLSSPDDIVKDGACSELYNMRYKDGAWRPVHPYVEKKFAQVFGSGYRVVYKHPATAEDKYIVEGLYDGKHHYYEVSINDTSMSQAASIATFDERQKMTHFGNVLMFTSQNKTSSYLWNQNKYIKINDLKAPSLSISEADEAIPYNLPPDIFRVNMDITHDPANNVQNSPVKYIKDLWLPRETLQECLDHIKAYNQRATSAYKINPIVECAWLLSDADTRNSSIVTHSGDYSFDGETSLITPDMWYGELMCFACYHLFDGSTTTPSPLQLIISNNNYDSRLKIKREEILKIAESSRYRNKEYVMMTIEWDTNYGAYTNVADINALSPITWQLPKLSIPEMRGLTSETISSIAIYATRINPIFDSDHIGAGKAPITMSTVSHFANNEMPSQPFYLVKEFPIRAEEDGINGPFTVDLTYDILQQSIHNKVYTPSISRALSGNTSLDYNNRLHIANIDSTFNREMILDNPFSDTEGTVMPYRASLVIKNATDSNIVTGSIGNGRTEFNDIFSRLLSVHDARAEKYIIENLDTKGRNTFMMQPALGNNIAYVYRSSSTAKFETLSPSDGDRQENNAQLLEDNSVLHESNRIQVSATNNPLTYPFENSYTIGSPKNTIIAMQSAAIKIGDEQVGALPLYVFSTEGIFALRAGESTLYAAVNPINYDKIINPNTLSINGAIVYITEKGVHLLTNAGSTVISSPIHGIDGTPPLDFLRNCTLLHPKQYNEVILYKEGSAAYIYNLDNDYWSTRVLDGVKINTDELVTSSGIIYDISKEDVTQNLDCNIATRPIKLGNVEFKRLETIIPRVQDDKQGPYRMRITGSVDKVNTVILRDGVSTATSGPLVFRRTPFSAKYFNVMVTRPAQIGTFAITHIDFEWYSRFGHRMR